MTPSRRARLLAIGASAALAAGLMSAGAVLAQDGSGEPPADTTQPAPLHAPGDGHWRRPVALGVLRSVLDASGLDAGIFKQGFEDGKTPNEILTENGLDPAKVQADALADIKSKLDARVSDGKITQEQADALYGRIEQRLPQFMESTHDLDGRHLGGRILHGIKNMLGSAADALGMQPRDLAQRLRGGGTIAGIAAEKGVPVDTVIDAMVANADARIDQAVTNGTIDQARADQMKANLRERVTTFVNEGPQHERQTAPMKGAGAYGGHGGGNAMSAMARAAR